MARQKIEIESGQRRYMATVLAEAGKYVVVTHNGIRVIAKRSLGAWREVGLEEVIARLASLEHTEAK